MKKISKMTLLIITLFLLVSVTHYIKIRNEGNIAQKGVGYHFSQDINGMSIFVKGLIMYVGEIVPDKPLSVKVPITKEGVLFYSGKANAFRDVAYFTISTTNMAEYFGLLETELNTLAGVINDPTQVKKADDAKNKILWISTALDQSLDLIQRAAIAYVEEDLRSPCTQEIAVFRAFAQIVEMAENEVVVIDTAPTGHTLLLLDATQSYHREVKRSQGNIPDSVKKLLPRLRNADETEVLIITLAEATPVYEAMRLEADLKRAGINNKWWIINSSLYATSTTNKTLKAKASNEVEWINKVNKHSNGNFAVIPWQADEIKGEKLLGLIK